MLPISTFLFVWLIVIPLKVSVVVCHTWVLSTLFANSRCSAPEVFDREYYSYGVDVWSFGVVMFEMGIGKVGSTLFHSLTHEGTFL